MCRPQEALSGISPGLRIFVAYGVSAPCSKKEDWPPKPPPFLIGNRKLDKYASLKIRLIMIIIRAADRSSTGAKMRIIPILLILSFLSFVVLCAQTPNSMNMILHLTGNQSYDHFGMALAALDFNGDGYQDLAVLQPFWVPDSLDAQISGTVTGRNWGRVLFYYGGPDFDGEADFTIEGEREWHFAPAVTAFCSIGDINGDGYDELLVYDYPNKLNIYFGAENPSDSPGIQLDPVAGLTPSFSFAVNALGDINGDGYDDFTYSYRRDYYPGGIKIVLGGSFEEITVAVLANGDQSKLNGIGDINNDAYDDFVLSLFHLPGGGVTLQQGFLHYGSAELDLSNPYPLTDLMNWGGPVREGFGDINGDGYDDFMGLMDGFIKVWYGGETLSNTYDIILEPYYVGSYIYNGSLAHGDFNGDGYSDVVGADPSIGGGRGRACIWMGGPVMNGTADLFFTGGGYMQFGYDIACGDFNGDGYDDIAFSEPCFTDSPLFWPGEVSVYAGNPDLHDTTVSNADEVIPSASGWKFRVIPNPSAQGSGIKLKFYGEGYTKLQDLSLRIHNLRGQEMYRGELASSSLLKGEHDFPNLSLPRGVFLVSLYRQNEKIKSVKMVVR